MSSRAPVEDVVSSMTRADNRTQEQLIAHAKAHAAGQKSPAWHKLPIGTELEYIDADSDGDTYRRIGPSGDIVDQRGAVMAFRKMDDGLFDVLYRVVPPQAAPATDEELRRAFGADAKPGDWLNSLTSAERKEIPMARGLLDYFPDALAAIARHSKQGNDKHNPGQPLHWSREKSSDHADCILRHLAGRGGRDGADGSRHSVGLAWRALALLQLEIEEAHRTGEKV